MCFFWGGYISVGEEGLGLGVRAGRAQMTYRCVEHYELQPGVKQRHVKLGDRGPSLLNSDQLIVKILAFPCIMGSLQGRYRLMIRQDESEL